MNILAFDTSCDETAVAVTHDLNTVSNCIWSQASLHTTTGGVIPSIAQREHQARIDFVTRKALGKQFKNLKNINAVAVTIGPGLAVALGVGINKAKELATKHKLPLIPVNHIEAHLLSSFAIPNSLAINHQSLITFPCLGLILSGGTTILCLVKNIGEYEILAETQDDALGEALDKGARLLGLGYPGGAILEKLAKKGNPDRFKLPIPLINDRIKDRFSYSGLKTAFVRLFEGITDPNKQDLADLAASYQKTAFEHILRVLEYQIISSKLEIKNLLFGGGVANNVEIKKMLRKVCRKHNIKLHTPYTKKLNGDNAGMIGVCAYLKNRMLNAKKLNNKCGSKKHIESTDRNPRIGI